MDDDHVEEYRSCQQTTPREECDIVTLFQLRTIEIMCNLLEVLAVQSDGFWRSRAKRRWRSCC